MKKRTKITTINSLLNNFKSENTKAKIATMVENEEISKEVFTNWEVAFVETMFKDLFIKNLRSSDFNFVISKFTRFTIISKIQAII